MKDKILTVEEIKEFMDTYNSIEDFTERSKFVEKYPIKTANIIRERMTLPLMEATDETNKEDVWNFINKCSTFAHCPGSQGDYKRMKNIHQDGRQLMMLLQNYIQSKNPNIMERS